MNLTKLLPDIYDQNATMQMLQKILSEATDNLDEKLSDIVAQCFVVTASTYLSRWEHFLGLDVDVSKSNEFRRERITAKLSGAGTTTKAMIVDVASRYSNGEVEVIEDNANNTFTIKFVGMLGIPKNIGDLKITIDEIKPAHLAVIYEYVYNIWDSVSGMTWAEASAYTWEGLRTVNLNENNE